MVAESFEVLEALVSRAVTAGAFSAVTSLPLGSSLGSSIDGSVSVPHAWWHELLRGQRPNGTSIGTISVADFFSGSGGLTLGAQFAINAIGMSPVVTVAADLDAEALAVYRRNMLPQITLQIDAASLVDYHVYGMGNEAELAYEPELLEPKISRFVGKIDLVLAGPPCQGHSNLNNHTRRNDPRNQLYVTAAAIGIALKAKAIVVENVPDVLRDKSKVVGTAQKILREAGYYVSECLINAAELGGAQTRRRHFTIATIAPHTPLSEVKDSLRKEPMPLRAAIGDLEHCLNTDFMNAEPVLSEENKARIRYLFEHDEYQLPNEIRPDSHKSGHTYPSVYGRLHWDKPAQTITTGFMSPGRGRYIHPTQPRVITPHEAARIQGFPDWYQFSPNGIAPSRRLLAKWIGDAVPTQLGYAAVLTALSGLEA